MITKVRNRALLQYGIALALTILLVILWLKTNWRQTSIADNIGIVVMFLYLAAITMWMVASFTLAKAKGHHPDTMGCVFIFLFFLGFCFPIAPFVFPIFVIFGLEDKTRARLRHRDDRRRN